MIEKLLVKLDRLAGWWIDWRSDQRIKNDPEMNKMGLRSLSTQVNGHVLSIVSPAIAVMADEASQMLKLNNAENYVQFDMMPRVDRGLRPIRVTVQWANGESPAEKAARLQNELDTIKKAWGLISELEEDIARITDEHQRPA